MFEELQRLLYDKKLINCFGSKKVYKRYSSLLNECILQKNINIVDENGWNLLHYASYYSLSSIIKPLILRGIDVNCQCYEGFTPLHLAVLNKDILCVKILLDSGVNPILKNNLGDIPSDYAKSSGLVEIEFLLLRAESRYKQDQSNILLDFEKALKL